MLRVVSRMEYGKIFYCLCVCAEKEEKATRKGNGRKKNIRNKECMNVTKKKDKDEEKSERKVNFGRKKNIKEYLYAFVEPVFNP